MALFQFSACGPKWCLWMSIILLLTSVRSFVYISKQVRYNKTLTSSCAGYFHIGYNSTNLRSKSTAATNPTTISRQPPYYPTLPVNWPRVINRGPIRSRDLCCVRRCQATGCWRQQLLQLRQSCHLLVQYRDVRMADESACGPRSAEYFGSAVGLECGSFQGRLSLSTDGDKCAVVNFGGMNKKFNIKL